MKHTKNYDIADLTIEDIKSAKLLKEDSVTLNARLISKNPKDIKHFRKFAVNEFNKSKELGVFLENLKILARVESIVKLTKKSNMKRNNVYKFLSKDSNPTLKNFLPVMNNLGIDFKAIVAV